MERRVERIEMSTREHHKGRIKELEELRTEIKDTGNIIEVDEAELARAVCDGQIQENVRWVTVMEGDVGVDKSTHVAPNTDLDKALEGIKGRVGELQNAGYMPKMKPLLYYLDFLMMDLNRIKEQVEKEQDPDKLQGLIIMQYKSEAKVEMTIDWLKVQDKAGDWGTMMLGDRGNKILLPTFGSKAEVDEAIATRHMPRHGETVEELTAGRVKRYRGDSKRITDGIDGQNKRDKEATDANQS
jgi:hypothetical protein